MAKQQTKKKNAPEVDPSEAEFEAAEAAAASDGDEIEHNTGETVHVESQRPAPGSWAKSQPPPEEKAPTYKLVTLAKPRRVLAEVPPEVVQFAFNDEGRRELVFDGIRCPRGVVTFHGVKCYLDGGPAQSPHARELAAARARLAELEARPVGQFAEAAQ